MIALHLLRSNSMMMVFFGRPPMYRTHFFALVLPCLLLGGCGTEGSDMVRAFTETLADTSKEFNEEYGAGAGKTIAGGTQAVLDIDHYRQAINILHEKGTITQTERDSRLASLFSFYDAFRAGRLSRAEFEQRATTLQTP
jgi:hypothetical protein